MSLGQEEKKTEPEGKATKKNKGRSSAEEKEISIFFLFSVRACFFYVF
jgi:hypothetical protein